MEFRDCFGFCVMCSSFRTRCAKKALTEPWRASGRRLRTVSTTRTKSKQCLNDTPTSTQIPYPHKPPLPDTKKEDIMKVISIVDDDYGIMFNNRRVSKDSVLNEHIIKMLDGRKLWLSLYSKQLFGDYENLEVNQEFGFAGKDDFCFVEDSEIVSYEDMVDEVYLYKWNRKYPSDVKFPKDMLKDFDMDGAADFEGNSHEKITEERYVRKK